jgi:hypothetical protein
VCDKDREARGAPERGAWGQVSDWSRRDLKARGREAFKSNYWKSVFVAFALGVLVFAGGGAGRAAGSGGWRYTSPEAAAAAAAASAYGVQDEDFASGSYASDDYGYDASETDATDEYLSPEVPTMTAVELAGILAGTLLVIGAVGILLGVFVLLPLEVGGKHFFVSNLRGPGRVQELLWAFDSSYLNIVKVMFLRDLKLLGWTLLFVVPGIVKYYEYRMIPYLLAEDPTLDCDAATAESRRMMDGNKWGAFVLDLSFLGWDLLSGLTLGLVGTFYSNPYHEGANAALFEALRYGDNPTPALPADPAGPVPPTGVSTPAAAEAVTSAPTAPAAEAPAEGGPVPPDGARADGGTPSGAEDAGGPAGPLPE